MGEFDKPTQRAEAYFSAVEQVASRVYTSKTLSAQDQAYMFEKMAAGLGEMAVGLRATYLLLEEVRDMVRRQKT